MQSALFFRKFEFRAVKSGKIILDGLCPADELEASVRPEKNLRRAALLQQLQEERKKLDNQIQSRSDLLKNLEASQRVDRILELYYQN